MPVTSIPNKSKNIRVGRSLGAILDE